VTADRFDRLLPLAGALIGLLFFVGLALTWGDPSSETAPAETFSYWQDNRGQHQISGLLLAPGLGARRNGMLPTPLVWTTIVIGASLLTPLGFFGFFLVPLWLIVVGLILNRSASQPGGQIA
jgi:hypothetical protein